MRVGIIQSSFIPWRGYFDFIASVDVFVFLEDVQYTVRDWRNRNRIKTASGLRWLSVPVRHRERSQLICETEIDRTQAWEAAHRGAWEQHYRQAPHFADVLRILDGATGERFPTISLLDIELTRRICAYLGIVTPLRVSSELGAGGTGTARLIDLVMKLGGDVYLSGPSAEAYLDKEAFARAGVGLEYKAYDYAPYPQLWGDFEGGVTVLDLIANCGRDAAGMLRSRTPDRIVVPAAALAR